MGCYQTLIPYISIAGGNCNSELILGMRESLRSIGLSLSCSNFPKKLLKSCSKILKVAQKLPQNPKVSQKLLSIFGCKRLIYNSNNDLINKFRFT